MDRWFNRGASRQPQDQSQSPATPQAIPLAKSPDEERIEQGKLLDLNIAKHEQPIPLKTTPEAEEGVHSVSALQGRFGKYVTEKGGAVPYGLEYNAVGSSPRCKELGITIPGNVTFPFGSGDLSNWGLKRKPFAIIHKEFAGKQWIICGMGEGIDSDGPGKGGRPSTEAHFIFIPAEEWSVGMIPDVIKKMDTTRLLKSESTMPELEVSNKALDEDLPEDWLNQTVRDMIVRIASGKTLSIQNAHVKELSHDDTLRRMFNVLMCMPNEVARRISFGTQLMDKSGQPTVGLRMFDGYHAFTARPHKLEGKDVWQRDKPETNKLGEEYLAALTPLIASAKTPREVMRAVTQLPRDLIERVSKRVYPQ